MVAREISEDTQTLVILIRTPLSCRDSKRFGLETLSARGFRLIVCDLSYYLCTRNYGTNGDGAAQMKGMGEYIEIRGFMALLSLMASNLRAVYIDHANLQAADLGLVKVALVVLRARYLLVWTNEFPDVLGKSSISAARRVLPKWRTLLARAVRKPSVLLLRWAANIQSANVMALVGGNAALRRARNAGIAKIVCAHSSDFDTYVAMQATSCPVASDKQIGVFLDENMPFHPDLQAGCFKRVEEAPYFAQLADLFDTIERELECTIMIAAHPRSRYAVTDPRFGGRSVVTGRTIELVRDATFVLCHESTSVNFAVLLDKPVVFVSVPAIDATEYGTFVRNHARLLHQPFVASSEEVRRLGRSLLSVPRDSYAEYSDNYIRCPNTGSDPLWEGVAACLQQAADGIPNA